MKGFVGVADNDWFAFLFQQPLAISIQGFSRKWSLQRLAFNPFRFLP